MKHKTYDIKVHLEFIEGEGDDVYAMNTSNGKIIDKFDGKVWVGFSFDKDDEITIDAKKMWDIKNVQTSKFIH